jgi:hypothetical protein
MNGKSKKVAAAIAAVNQFIEEEVMEQAARPAAPPACPSLWSVSGRQAIMNNRFLVTARMWK